MANVLWAKQDNDIGIEEFLWINGKCVGWVMQKFDGVWVFTWAERTGRLLANEQKVSGPYDTVEAAKLAAEVLYG